jgi:Flp pilus assembly pilin Flp
MPERNLMNPLQDESGAVTAEYALVMVAAATIALALIIWASNTGALPELFDSMVARVKALGG